MDMIWRSAAEQAQAVWRGQVSAVELLHLHWQQCDRLNPQLNAVVVQQRDVALLRAREADAARARGQRWGPLHGVPMTVKEAFDIQGLPTTWGLEARRQHRASANAVTAQRLLDAGAVIWGKTNVPVALADWQSYNPVYGTANNPWDLARSPGGSSGGSAAALAAGITAVELGSDIGSSIRNPAHYCGVWGHKPSWGLVPLGGHQLGEASEEDPDVTDIAVAGPMARGVADLALALDILVGEPTLPGPHGRQPVRWADQGTPARRMRVAIMSDDPLAPVDAPVRLALVDLGAWMQQQGLEVSYDARPVPSDETWAVFIGLVRAALADGFGDAEYAQILQKAAPLRAQQQGTGGPGAPVHATQFPAAQWCNFSLHHRDWLLLNQRRQVLRRQWAHFFQQWDVFISPIASTSAIEHNQQGFRWERFINVNGQPLPHTAQLLWAGYSGVVGLPSTAVPLGLCPKGLPIGAQIIGPSLGDPMCLRMAQWLEQGYRSFQAPPMAWATATTQAQEHLAQPGIASKRQA